MDVLIAAAGVTSVYDVFVLALNVAQTCFLAYLAAAYTRPGR